MTRQLSGFIFALIISCMGAPGLAADTSLDGLMFARMSGIAGAGISAASTVTRIDAGEIELIPPDFNYLPIPQFRISRLGGIIDVFNGGNGNGTRSAYFCGPFNELKSYMEFGGSDVDLWTPDGNSPAGNRGSYKFVQIEDRCRTDGCGGEIARDNICTVIGSPTHAMNCFPLVGGDVWDAPEYQQRPPAEDGIRSPGSIDHGAWQDRNFVNDGFGFIFGRYLVDRTHCVNPNDFNEEQLARRMKIGTPNNFEYAGITSHPQFIDIPYSERHLANGFACPAVFRAGGYPRFNSHSVASGAVYRMRGNWGGMHRQLMQAAADRLARNIAMNGYGNMYPNPFGVGEGQSVEERERAEVIVTAWNILDWATRHVDWEPCTGWSCVRSWIDRLFGSEPIEIGRRMRLSGKVPVEYDHEANKIYINSYIAQDCNSKRTKGSHAHYNTSTTDSSGDGRCIPSYGEWMNGGLYERHNQMSSGYDLYFEDDQIVAEEGGYVPAEGYAPFISAQLAHQLCHAFFRHRYDIDRMSSWPSHAALWEEGTCVETEALVYTNLCQLGYCTWNFRMEKEDFVRDVTRYGGPNSTIIGTERGERYSYPNHCRSYGGTFQGPYCTSVFNIATALGRLTAEQARTMALMKSMAPTMIPPGLMSLNGEEMEFRLPDVERRGIVIDVDADVGRSAADNLGGGMIEVDRSDDGSARRDSDDPSPYTLEPPVDEQSPKEGMVKDNSKKTNKSKNSIENTKEKRSRSDKK